MVQLDLLEPRRAECAEMAARHLAKSAGFRRAADVFKARGMFTLAGDYAARADGHEFEAECLAMYADFLGRAGVGR